MTGVNPARFSLSVIEKLRELIPKYVHPSVLVFDPFAGEGMRLARLCCDLGYGFIGNDLEAWEGQSAQVLIRDSTLLSSYPTRQYAIVTSPTYNNGVNDSFTRQDGTRGITYTFAAGHQLHPNNTGRYSGRSSKRQEAAYWALHQAAIDCWPSTGAFVAMINVKDSIRSHSTYPLVHLWTQLLTRNGFRIVNEVQCEVPSNRFGSNRDLRVAAETILVAIR